MDIWITWCRKQANCNYCGKPILKGKPMVRGKYWRRKDGTAARWSIKLYWHPGHWLKEGLTKLQMTPFVSRHIGKPKLALDEESARQRLRLLRRRAVELYRLKDVLQRKPSDTPVDFLIEFDEEVMGVVSTLLRLRQEIEQYGGAPKSWDEPIESVLSGIKLK